MDYTVIHDEKVSRFEILESGQIAYLQYLQQNDILNMFHTFVPPVLEGQGIGSALAKCALDYVRDNELKVKPTCPFVHAYIQKNREYENLII